MQEMSTTTQTPPQTTPRRPTDAEIKAEILENEADLLAIARGKDQSKASEARVLLCELRDVKREFKELRKLDRRSLRKALRKERKRKERRRMAEKIVAGVEADELGKTIGMMAELTV